MTVFCMVEGLGANAYSVSRSPHHGPNPNPNPNPNPSPTPIQVSRALAMAATPPLAVLVLGTRVSASFLLASGAVALGGHLYARYQPGARPHAARPTSPASADVREDAVARRAEPGYSAGYSASYSAARGDDSGEDDVTAPLVQP